jgi:hypothetical protein
MISAIADLETGYVVHETHYYVSPRYIEEYVAQHLPLQNYAALEIVPGGYAARLHGPRAMELAPNLRNSSWPVLYATLGGNRVKL